MKISADSTEVIGTSIGTEMNDVSIPRRGRGRPRSFDPATVLARIRECFSQKGFSGASVDDLADATGISKPSLYGAFGDKRAMFLKALDSEFRELSSRLDGIDHSQPTGSKIAAYLAACAAAYGYERPESGGLAFGAALTDAATDATIRAALDRFGAALDAAAEAVLGQGASSAAASLLSSLAVALCVRGRLNKRCDLEGIIPLLQIERSKAYDHEASPESVIDGTSEGD